MTDPVEGFAPEIPDDSNLYNWRIYLEGPKDTMYEGGVFQLNMAFPRDYPMAPPELRFISDFWHPNGTSLCISLPLPRRAHAKNFFLQSAQCLPTVRFASPSFTRLARTR